MFNPEEMLSDVIGLIKEVPIINTLLSEAQKEKNVAEYDDEFKTAETSWQFSFPSVFVRVLKAIPRFKYVDGGSDVYDYDIVLFIAHDEKDSGATNILQIAKNIRDYLEGQELTLTEGAGPDESREDFKIQCGEFDFYDKINACKIYTLELGTIPG